MVITNKTYTPIADGQTGAAVAATLNTALADVLSQTSYRFEQSDAVSQTPDSEGYYYFDITHNKNTENLIASLKDEAGITQSLTGNFFILNDISFRLRWSSVLTEAMTLTVNYTL